MMTGEQRAERYNRRLLTVVDERAKKPLPTEFAISNNAKAGKSFNLPPGMTCPGRTPACKDCYATQGMFNLGKVKQRLVDNQRLFNHYRKRGDDWSCAVRLIHAIGRYKKPFRIHGSGDFQDQFAVDVWKIVVDWLPRVQFWAYTRSFHLDFANLSRFRNVSLFASWDDHNREEALAFAMNNGCRVAFGPWEPGREVPPDSIVCPVTDGRLNCAGACAACRVCIEKDNPKNVVFLRHLAGAGTGRK